MPTDVEYALSKIEPATFEKVASDVLRDYGYEVSPSGIQGTDAGRDAIVKINGEPGIAHYSTQSRWRSKLRKDGGKAADHDEEYDWFVFVTNQEVSGGQEAAMRREVLENYGWELDLWHHERLRNKIETDIPDIARRHLGVDPQGVNDVTEQIGDFKDGRIEAIENRRDLPTKLAGGPFVAIHVFPNGMQSMDYETRPSKLPPPPEYGKTEATFDAKPVDDGKLYVRHYEKEVQPKYTFLHEDGWIEAVSTDYFGRFSTTSGYFHAHRFDAEVVSTVHGAMDTLKDLGAKPPIFLYVSVVGFRGVEMWYTDKVEGPIKTPEIPKEKMKLKRVEADSFDEDIPMLLKPTLDRFWNGCGWSVGCIDYRDGEWDPYYRR
jgi:hypothetical protein